MGDESDRCRARLRHGCEGEGCCKEIQHMFKGCLKMENRGSVEDMEDKERNM